MNEENRLDDLAKAMSKQTSRRGVLRILAIGAGSGVLGAIGLRGASTADAKGPCVPLTNPCNTNPNDRPCCGANTTCQVEEDTTGIRSGHCLCATGFFDCNGSCIANGQCCPACATGLTCCGGTTCQNLSTDSNNCGACGNVCTGANVVCTAGACVCDTGFKLCNGVCIPNSQCCTNADCVAGANSTGTCTSGTCSYTCNTGFTDCNGDVQSGSAGDGCECASPNTCVSGVCTAPSLCPNDDPKKSLLCTHPANGRTKCCPYDAVCDYKDSGAISCGQLHTGP